VTSAQSQTGKKLWFFSNWSWEQRRLTVPLEGHELFSGEPFKNGAALALGAWDVKVIVRD
jgi:hypothetical protein